MRNLQVAIFLICLFSLVIIINCENVTPIVQLPKLGFVQGKVIKSAWSSRTIYKFTDVKYAESPGGDNRFKAPIAVRPWRGIKDATRDGIACPSILALDSIAIKSKTQDMEDCLSMTITTSNLSTNAKHPVMVYIHGEYLYEGSNAEAPGDYILEKDVVLVVPQYRLGPFGFLSTMTSEIPGNAAVFDIILALYWVHHFIEYFGGDPERVTLIGQVGGAAITHLLTFSPAVPANLFHQVIYHSGSALMPVFLAEQPTNFAIDIAEKSGCNVSASNDLSDINTCLKELSTVDLLEGFQLHAAEKAGEGIGSYGGIQFTIGGPSGVLPIHPSLIYLSETNISYPTIGGVPKNVGSRTMKEIFLSDFDGEIPDYVYNGEDYVNHVIIQGLGLDKDGVLTDFLKNKFFTSEELKNGTFMAMIPGLIDLAGTIVHKIPVLRALQRNAKHLPQKTWLFSFDYRGEFNRYPDIDDIDSEIPFENGVSLTDDNIYLFPYPDNVKNLNAKDHQIARQMVELWTSFATKGIPSTPEIIWPPKTDMNGPYLKIDEISSIGENFFDEFSATISDKQNNY